jgi:hypothetical protein
MKYLGLPYYLFFGFSPSRPLLYTYKNNVLYRDMVLVKREVSLFLNQKQGRFVVNPRVRLFLVVLY